MDRLLLLGPLPTKSSPRDRGGVVNSFGEFVAEMRRLGVDVDVIDINRRNYSSVVSFYVSLLRALFFKARKVDHISFQATAAAVVYIGVIVVAFARVYGVPLTIKKFAGSFDIYYMKAGFVKKSLIRYVCGHADRVFFQTKYLSNFFAQRGVPALWIPNARRRKIQVQVPRLFRGRLVYFGSVSMEKGVGVMLEAHRKSERNYSLDIYGPLNEEQFSQEVFERPRVKYHGVVPFSQVLEYMNQYDVLLMPSTREQEGYPGVILEAYSLGIPVIASSLRGIREILADGEEGLLVEPGSAAALTDAIDRISSLYKDMSVKAYARFKDFDAVKIYPKYIREMNSVGDE